MRDRLLAAQANQQLQAEKAIQSRLHETQSLALTAARLEQAQRQLRETQATLIAERLAKVRIEEQSKAETDGMRDCRNELAGAIRALRRAREEGKRTDEEKRRLARCFEETKAQSVNINPIVPGRVS